MQSSIIDKWNKYATILVLVILVLIPLILVLLRSFTPDGRFEGLAPLAILGETSHRQTLLNSLFLGLGVVIGSSLLAAPLAFLMARTDMKKHRWIDVVLIIPFMTPPYIGAMGWILAMQSNGIVEEFFGFFEPITPYFFSYFGMVLIMSLHLFPFIYTIMRNSLLNIGGRLEEAGTVHGGRFLYRMRRIIIPLFLSGYSMGALLVFVKTIGEFGTPVTLGNRIGYYVLTSEIHRHATIWPIDYGTAAILSTMLISVSMFAWYMQQWMASRRHDTVVSGKGQSSSDFPLGKKKILGWGYLFIVLALSIGIPYTSVISTAFLDVQADGIALDNLTFEHMITLFTDSRSREALLNSLWLAGMAATISAGIGIWIAALVTKRNKPVERTIDFLSLAPNTLPAIVFIIGLILFWNAAWMPSTIYNTWMMLVLTYVILYLPFTVQNIKAIYGQMSPSLIQAAYVSGASRLYQFRTVLIPLIFPGILAGWMMTFIISMRELVGSLILRPPDMHTTATFIYSEFEQGSTSVGMAMALIAVSLTIVVLVFVERWKDRSQSYRQS